MLSSNAAQMNTFCQRTKIVAIVATRQEPILQKSQQKKSQTTPKKENTHCSTEQDEGNCTFASQVGKPLTIARMR